mmetsp:Transcript_66759/g.159676  ORF Transcript_66759/g.159676 Transcript_66759/m.159676 type:complete len:140 (-) Transcript_66759:210-629(-)
MTAEPEPEASETGAAPSAEGADADDSVSGKRQAEAAAGSGESEVAADTGAEPQAAGAAPRKKRRKNAQDEMEAMEEEWDVQDAAAKAAAKLRKEMEIARLKHKTRWFKDADGDIANEFWREVNGKLTIVTDGLVEVFRD